MLPNLRAAVGLWAVGLAALGQLTCTHAAAKAPHPTRPLQQARARTLIAEVIAQNGLRPAGERVVEVAHGKHLSVDVTIVGFKLGIAYVTGPERQVLGDGVPAHDVGSDALRLIRDAADPTARVLLLHDSAYVTDEELGEERERSAVAVEGRLRRDVQDFLAEARKQSWP